MTKPSSILLVAFVFVVAISVLYYANRLVEKQQLPIKQAMAMCIQWADLIAHNPGETGNLIEEDGWGTLLRKEVSDVSYRIVSAGPDKKFGNKDDIDSDWRKIVIVISGTPDEVPEAVDDSQDQANAEPVLQDPEAESDG